LLRINYRKISIKEIIIIMLKTKISLNQNQILRIFGTKLSTNPVNKPNVYLLSLYKTILKLMSEKMMKLINPNK
jgi:hypothetical protein